MGSQVFGWFNDLINGLRVILNTKRNTTPTRILLFVKRPNKFGSCDIGSMSEGKSRLGGFLFQACP